MARQRRQSEELTARSECAGGREDIAHTVEPCRVRFIIVFSLYSSLSVLIV